MTTRGEQAGVQDNVEEDFKNPFMPFGYDSGHVLLIRGIREEWSDRFKLTGRLM